jgi:beta-glucosidase
MFDSKNKTPQFPFGYGLSYTTFDFSNLKIEKEFGNGVHVKFRITNTGSCAGAEVAQVYAGAVNSEVERPVRELKGFEKIYLNPGESKIVNIHLDEKAFSYFSDISKSWVTEPGKIKIEVGSSSRDIKLKEVIKL